MESSSRNMQNSKSYPLKLPIEDDLQTVILPSNNPRLQYRPRDNLINGTSGMSPENGGIYLGRRAPSKLYVDQNKGAQIRSVVAHQNFQYNTKPFI